jgi:hypothetical protein
MLTPSLLRKIADSLEANPLGETEIRRLEGVGGHFMCRANVPLPDEYAALVTFDFAGNRYAFVRWLGKPA